MFAVARVIKKEPFPVISKFWLSALVVGLMEKQNLRSSRGFLSGVLLNFPVEILPCPTEGGGQVWDQIILVLASSISRKA